MADPKAPSFAHCIGQLCQALGILPKDLGSLLSAHGLHVVSEADKRVLEAMSRVPRDTLERSLQNALHGPEHSREPAAAELARRTP